MYQIATLEVPKQQLRVHRDAHVTHLPVGWILGLELWRPSRPMSSVREWLHFVSLPKTRQVRFSVQIGCIIVPFSPTSLAHCWSTKLSTIHVSVAVTVGFLALKKIETLFRWFPKKLQSFCVNSECEPALNWIYVDRSVIVWNVDHTESDICL